LDNSIRHSPNAKHQNFLFGLKDLLQNLNLIEKNMGKTQVYDIERCFLFNVSLIKNLLINSRDFLNQRGPLVNTYDKILIVDDDDILRESMVTILENEGYILDVARSGYEAKLKLNNKIFNLVILDIRLPDTNGLDLLTSINREAPMMKKIVLTGFPDTETAIKSVNEKADAYLVKPFEPEKLIEVISEKLKQQKDELKYTQDKVLEYIRSRVKELDSQQSMSKRVQ
jgi:DNA-binding NarL/FixJ family response regulator